MFQDELQKLQIKIVEYQEQLAKAEAQRQSLGEKLSAATSRADNAESALKVKDRELGSALNDLSSARQSVERFSMLEQMLVSEQEEKKKALEHLSSLSDSLEKTSQRLRESEGQLSEAKAELFDARSKLDPVGKLLSALDVYFSSEKTIRDQLKVLKGNG